MGEKEPKTETAEKKNRPPEERLVIDVTAVTQKHVDLLKNSPLVASMRAEAPGNEDVAKLLQTLDEALRKLDVALKGSPTVRLDAILTQDQRDVFLDTFNTVLRAQVEGGQGGVGTRPEFDPGTAIAGEAFKRLTWLRYDVRDEYLPEGSARPKEYDRQVARFLEILITKDHITLWDFHEAAQVFKNGNVQQQKLFIAKVRSVSVPEKDTELFYDPEHLCAMGLIVGLVEKSTPLLQYVAKRRGQVITEKGEWMRSVKASEIFRISATARETTEEISEGIGIAGRAFAFDIYRELKDLDVKGILTRNVTAAPHLWDGLRERISRLQIPPRAADMLFGSLLPEGQKPPSNLQKECVGLLKHLTGYSTQPLADFKNALEGRGNTKLLENLTEFQKTLLQQLCNRFMTKEGAEKIVDEMMSALELFENDRTRTETAGEVRTLFLSKIQSGAMDIQDIIVLQYLTGDLASKQKLPLAIKCMQLIDRYGGEAALRLSVPRQHAFFNRIIGLAYAAVRKLDIEEALKNMNLPEEAKTEVRNMILYTRDEIADSIQKAEAHGEEAVKTFWAEWQLWIYGGGAVLFGTPAVLYLALRRKFRLQREAYNFMRLDTLESIAERYNRPLQEIRNFEQEIRDTQRNLRNVRQSIDDFYYRSPELRTTHPIGTRIPGNVLVYKLKSFLEKFKLVKPMEALKAKIEGIPPLSPDPLHQFSQSLQALRKQFYEVGRMEPNSPERMAAQEALDKETVRLREIARSEFNISERAFVERIVPSMPYTPLVSPEQASLRLREAHAAVLREALKEELRKELQHEFTDKDALEAKVAERAKAMEADIQREATREVTHERGRNVREWIRETIRKKR